MYSKEHILGVEDRFRPFFLAETEMPNGRIGDNDHRTRSGRGMIGCITMLW